jgi:hypothetical protein
MTPINTNLLYDDDGFCRLCGLGKGEHTDECPGPFIHKLRYEVTYGGRNCHRGCCGGVNGYARGDTLAEAVTAASIALMECVSFRVEARIISEISEDVGSMVTAETKRIKQELRGLTGTPNAQEALELNTKSFAYGVRALEAERGELKPEAYERRMQALRERYRALGVVIPDHGA